MKDAEVLGR